MQHTNSKGSHLRTKGLIILMLFIINYFSLDARAAEVADEFTEVTLSVATGEGLVSPTTATSYLEEKQGYTYSENDKLALAQVIYAEANGESLRGKLAVASVVLNRFFCSDQYWRHDSIQNLIRQPGQFATCSLSREEILASAPDCFDAISLAIKGFDPTAEVFASGALFYGADWKHGRYGETHIIYRISDGATLMVIDRQAYRVVY